VVARSPRTLGLRIRRSNCARLDPSPDLGDPARALWEPLPDAIEKRWCERFGAAAVAELRAACEAIVAGLDVRLPRYIPVLGYGFVHTAGEFPAREPAAGGPLAESLDLSALLSGVLLAFALDFEAHSELSFALCANLLHVLGERGVPLRELPRASGISKEAIAMASGFLARHGLAVVEPDPDAVRVKTLRLNAAGLRSRDEYLRNLAAAEKRMAERFGSRAIRRLRRALENLIDARADGQPLLARGLVPHPGGWRARKPYLDQTAALLRDPAATLPRYPMVLHRGGWPDGS
jgi:DNA-binding MarR family transcriptional regulator